jgi:putative addiction module component (TIGR02574 family)
MGLRIDELFEQAMKLPGEDRLQLAEALLSSFSPPGEPPFDPAWLNEAMQRAARIDSGEAKLSTWSEVRDRARRTLGSQASG